MIVSTSQNEVKYRVESCGNDGSAEHDGECPRRVEEHEAGALGARVGAGSLDVEVDGVARAGIDAGAAFHAAHQGFAAVDSFVGDGEVRAGALAEQAGTAA